MDLDNVDAPQFVDFDLIKQGHDEGEGDEWFDTCRDENDAIPLFHTPDEPTELVATTTEPISMTTKPVAMTTECVNTIGGTSPVAMETNVNETKPVAMATTQPTVAMATDTSSDVNELSNVNSKSEALIRMNKKRQPSERTAALKATASIHSMVKSGSKGKINSGCGQLSSTTATGQISKSKLQTKEQLELEKIKQLRENLEKTKALSKKSFKSLYSKKNKTTQKRLPSPKPTTEPIGFNFKTDERFKLSKDATTTVSATPCSVDVFPLNLRTTNDRPFLGPNDPTEKATPRGPTKVKPFKFHTAERLRSKSVTQEKFVSNAEFSENFVKKTPPRFRSRPRRSASNERDYTSTLTMPRSPKLKSRFRSRSPVASHVEREEKYMEDLKKNQFKAQPVPSTLYEQSGVTGLRTNFLSNKLPSTIPVSPNITKPGSKRNRVTTEGEGGEGEEEREGEDTNNVKKFKALPVPRDIFKTVTGVPIKRPREVTVPLSPHLTKKPHIEDKEEEEPHQLFKALPMPKSTHVPFQPVLEDKQVTLPVPFSFDNKYPTKDEFIGELVRRDEEELAKKREFIASKLPMPSTPAPIIKPHAHTLPQPFQLMTDERGEIRSQKFTEQVKELHKQMKDNTKFKASEPTLLYSKPFLPVKATKPLTEFNPFNLESETRAEQRAKYDNEKKVREEEKQLVEQERQALREKEEEEEIKHLRRSLVHKAQPIHQYSGILIQPSAKPVTKPLSPKLSTRTRTE